MTSHRTPKPGPDFEADADRPDGEPTASESTPPTTRRIRRSVTGRIENRSLPGEPTQVVCTNCGLNFVAVARTVAAQVPCVHCGTIQAVSLKR